MRLVLFCLLYSVACLVHAVEAQTSKAKVAIIIDDLGYNLSRGRQAIDLPVPLTLAFLPDRNYTQVLAKYAHNKGKTIMLHMPMESESGFPMGEYGLEVGMSDKQKRQKLDEALAAVPYAMGVNNHMGSRMTRDQESMSWLMKELNRHQMFFIDSLTVADSLGWKTAESTNTPYATRTVFLDNDLDPQSLDRQFEILMEKARKNGHAIAIAHPHPETLRFLRMRLPLAQQYEPVTFVYVDKLLLGKAIASQ
ncbi:divergent polysaccharide deacetylase family protein [Gynuella sp.]|uniref:divergent polysaccharide deacetylase family protein n=1 Tax=Gynuella sp. TaxID=2969146 RepID=UPI003D101EDF